MARSWHTLGAIIGCFVLLALVEKGMSAKFQCYSCEYREVDGQFEAAPETDINCKSSPQLTSTVPCTGGCVNLEYTQTITFFGMKQTFSGLLRNCTDNITPMLPIGASLPNPGTCLKDDAFESWFMSTFAEDQPAGQPMGPMGPGHPPMGPGQPTPFPLGSMPPFPAGSIPPFPFGTIPPGFPGTQNPFEGGNPFEGIEGFIEIDIDGSVCTCTSDFCLKDTFGGTGGSAGMRPAYIMLVTGVIVTTLLSKLVATD